MKKLFFLILTITLTVALTLPVSAETYEQYLFNAFYPITVTTPSGSTVEGTYSFTISDTAQSYPLGATNQIDIIPFLQQTYDNYIYGEIPSNWDYSGSISDAPLLTLTWYPLSSTDTSSVITENDYLNHLEMRCAIAIPSNIPFDEYTNYIGLYWNRADAVGQGDLMAMYAMNASRLISIENQFEVIFQGDSGDGSYYQRNLTIYVTKLEFILDEKIPIDDARAKTFSLKMPLINPWFRYVDQVPDTPINYQFACDDLKLDVVTVDDIIADIGSQLGDVNNNLIILQNLNQDIIDALLKSEYAEEVQAYIDSVNEEKSKADNAANIEASLWNMFDDYEYSFDADASLDLMKYTDFLWKDWVISAVILAVTIALTARVLYG